MSQYSFTSINDEKLRAAKNYIRNLYGTGFLSKASDELLLVLRSIPQVESFAVGAPSGNLTPAIVLELDIKQVSVPVKEVPISREHWQAVFKEQRLVESLENQLQNKIRVDRMNAATESQILFDKATEPMEATFQTNVPATPSVENVPESIEKCWLNSTLRGQVDAQALAEVVADASVLHVDTPRRLQLDEPRAFAEVEDIVEGIHYLGDCIGAPQWRARRNTTGKGVIVAVLDKEVDINHPGLDGRIHHKSNYTNENWSSPDPHGTAVAGIIAGIGDITGIAPDSTIYNYKVLATDPLLSADDFGGALAIQQALTDGADIANCSWGSGPAVDGTSREARACDTAWALGMTIVKSAGNKGDGLNTMTTPADAEGVIVVGATNIEGTIIPKYSSRGLSKNSKGPHMLAPGGSPQMGVKSCLVGGGYGFCGMGTSFAAPHVAGLVALLLELRPGMTPDELRTALLSTCIALGRGSEHEGHGLVDIRRL